MNLKILKENEMRYEELAIDSIDFPVKYEKYGQTILDVNNHKVLDIRGWGRIQKLSEPEKRQDAIGELVASLLNDKWGG